MNKLPPVPWVPLKNESTPIQYERFRRLSVMLLMSLLAAMAPSTRAADGDWLNGTSDIGGSSPGQIITLNGPVTGAGGLIAVGLATLTLNGTNTYAGGATINAETLALGSSGSLSNTLSLTIGAGETLDVSAVNTYALNSRTMLSANGTGTQSGSTAAAIKGALGGTVNLAACPVVLTYDGLHPALYISQGTLSLDGNAFVVNSSSPLGVGTYTIIQQAGGDVIGAGSFSVTGTAVGPGMSGLISVSGGKVNLAVQKEVTDLTVSFAGTNAVVSYRAAPGSQNYFWNSSRYVLQRSTNANVDAGWVPISTNMPTTNQWCQVTDNFNDLGSGLPAPPHYRVQVTKGAQEQILAAPPAPSPEQPYRFGLKAGPQFTTNQMIAQRRAGRWVAPFVQQAFRAGASSVRIPPGDYRFGQETWGPIVWGWPASGGVIYPLEFSGLQRDSQHPFTIDASGATFWFDLPNDQSGAQHFCVGFLNCSNIIFFGATIDRGTRGQVEGCITNFDFVGNRIEMVLSPGCTIPASFNNNPEQRLLPFKADGRFCAPLYALQAGGTKLKYLSITPSTNPGCCWVNLATPDLLQTVTNSTWLNACGELGRLRVGDGLSCIYTVSAGVQLVNSADLTMYGVNVYVAKALGAEWYGAGNHLWKDCYFGPRPGTSQWQGGDGFMFCGTGRGPTLDHVTMLHTTDDMANFHGYWTEAIAAAGNQLTFTLGQQNLWVDSGSGSRPKL
jgi:hypothetical protein